LIFDFVGERKSSLVGLLTTVGFPSLVIVFVELPVGPLIIDRDQVEIKDQWCAELRPIKLNPIGQYFTIGSSRKDLSSS